MDIRTQGFEVIGVMRDLPSIFFEGNFHRFVKQVFCHYRQVLIYAVKIAAKSPNLCGLGLLAAIYYTNSASRSSLRMSKAGSFLPNHLIRTRSLIQYKHGTITNVSTVENVRP